MITRRFFIGDEMDLALAPGSTPLTGIIYADLAILQQLDDSSLEVLPVCSKYLAELCRYLWKNKLVEKYGPWILGCKPEIFDYRQYYFSLDDVHPISTGEDHIVVVCKNGHVYSAGGNGCGQLGLGDKQPDTPGTGEDAVAALVQVPEPIRSVACGAHHTILVAREGNVYSFGFNSIGQLGLGRCGDQYLPELVPGLPLIRYVACGGHHTVVVGFEGDVYVFGYNDSGQLGLGDTSNVYGPDMSPHTFPTQIQGLPPIRMAAAGNNSTVLLAFNGAVYTCGGNRYGQLGLGHTETRFVFTQIMGIPPIQAVACGGYHTVLLAFNGKLYSFGSNNYGQLGLGDTNKRCAPTKIKGLPPIRSIACGRSYFICVDFDDNAYCSGEYIGENSIGGTVPTSVKGVPSVQIRHASSGWLPVLLDSDDNVHFLNRSIRTQWPWGTT